MGGRSKSQTVGYRYSLGAHLALCHGPVDAIREIRVDDRTAWSIGTGQSSSASLATDMRVLPRALRAGGTSLKSSGWSCRVMGRGFAMFLMGDGARDWVADLRTFAMAV